MKVLTENSSDDKVMQIILSLNSISLTDIEKILARVLDAVKNCPISTVPESV